MRTIKFRGKRVDNGVWVYGKLNPCDTRPTVAGFFVNPKTVGQFTGFHDTNNGSEIYEGDIIHLNDEEFELEHGNGIVVFLEKDISGNPCGGLWYVEDADEDSRTDTGLMTCSSVVNLKSSATYTTSPNYRKA